MARVGLLEDNARIAKMCATMLQFAGHSVETYSHPQVCLDALLQPLAVRETTGSPYATLSPDLPIELLILDLHLPEIPGIEVVQHLKAQEITGKLPLIFCTASTTHEILHALRLAPTSLVVEKPFKLDVLVSAVETALLL